MSRKYIAPEYEVCESKHPCGCLTVERLEWRDGECVDRSRFTGYIPCPLSCFLRYLEPLSPHYVPAELVSTPQHKSLGTFVAIGGIIRDHKVFEQEQHWLEFEFRSK